MASNYKFLTEPDDSLKCLICLEVAIRDPKQHEDCGKLFCSECIEKHGKKPCPYCRVENPQYFKDKKSLREIRDLRVKCDYVERGCDWEGTVGMLDDHVTKCGLTLASCPNKCKVEGEGLQLMRKELDRHLTKNCPNRIYHCQHCGEKGTYASITGEHESICIKKIVHCPNSECTLTMERGLTTKHVQNVCKYTVVACKYANIGCNVKKMRIDMEQHEVDDKSHFPLALEIIAKLVNDISSLKNTISSLENTSSVLKKDAYTLNEKTITFKLPGYSKMKENNEAFYSEPFYTSPGGYKICIRVCPNGSGDGEGTHVSFFSPLLEGPYNDSLHWPFFGTVTVELLNQLADDHHYSWMISFNNRKNARASGRLGDAWGCPKFFSHSKLSHNPTSNTQYLMEDTLYFRVTVKVDHHKPWLDCTHHTE